jgi:hypothetical protein
MCRPALIALCKGAGHASTAIDLTDCKGVGASSCAGLLSLRCAKVLGMRAQRLI